MGGNRSRFESFSFAIRTGEPINDEVIEWLRSAPNRSELIRDAVVLFYLMQKHGIAVQRFLPFSAQNVSTAGSGSDEAERDSAETTDPLVSALRAGLEDLL